MCGYLSVKQGQSEVAVFSDGNMFVRIGENVRGKDIFLVQPVALNPNKEFVEILFWLDAFRRASARSVTLVMPYFSYARGDKKDEPRVSIRGRVCADCIDMLGAVRIITMDLHSPQIQGFFTTPVDHLYAMPVLSERVKALDFDDFVVVSPDAGFAKAARSYADHLTAPLAIADKVRSAHDEKARVLEVIGDVKGRNALVVDDVAVSGGTLVDLAFLLQKQGARRIIACVSHVALSQQGVARIENSPIERIIATDSIDNERTREFGKVTEVSIAPLFAEAVKRISAAESVSVLFDNVPDRVVSASTRISDQEAVPP
jgi:ribose-phosphate pyrophosphokinase